MVAKSWEAYWANEDHHDWWKRPAPEVLELIASQSPQERPSVLDLGCGLGRHAIAFARAGFRVAGTDASPTAIACLRGWAQELGLTIRIKTCDVLDEVWPTGSFDIVLSYNVLYQFYSNWHILAEKLERIKSERITA